MMEGYRWIEHNGKLLHKNAVRARVRWSGSFGEGRLILLKHCTVQVLDVSYIAFSYLLQSR